MSELGGLAVLALGLGLLAATGMLAACCLRPGSLLRLLLAAYVVAWAWLVTLVLALSPAGLVTRRWLLFGLVSGALAAAAAWVRAGRPRPPAPGEPRAAFERPEVFVLALAVGLGAVYSAALAFLTPANDGDTLAYHIPRAAFWKQSGEVGYIADAPDLRLNVSPPNAELGQLATMLLAQTDRYVAVPQLAAYAALLACVAAIGRRLGLSAPEAAFSALAFGTLPVVVLQASTALNDLVVASFLAIAVLFALTPGREALVLASLALGLALGTKFTAVLALPALALVVALARPRPWRSLVVAGVFAVALGAPWYVLNIVETGEPDGGLGAEADQRVALAIPDIVVNLLRYALDFLDLSGLLWPYQGLLIAAAAVVALSLRSPTGSARFRLALLGFALTIAPLAAPRISAVGEEVTIRTWAALGRPDTPPFERGWGVNLVADPAIAWFGGIGTILLFAGAVVVARRRALGLPTWAPALVAAPLVVFVTLAAFVVWDPWRGRFFVFAVALAAATWGVFLRSTVVARAALGIAVTGLVLALATYAGKPSGVGEIWEPELSDLSADSVWDDSRSVVQTRLSPLTGERPVYEYFEDAVPAGASVALALRENDFVSPYFGARLRRDVHLVRHGDAVPRSVAWLVLAPGVDARRCRDAWQLELSSRRWRVERRVSRDACAIAVRGDV